jgi:glucose-1-phosphate cytidylyltransferase
MKVVILAGGLGTRIGDETSVRPKPMVEVGPRPILWHVMKIYAHYGLKDFVILCGYKAEVIRNYFLNYARNESDFTVDLQSGTVMPIGDSRAEDWRVTLLDTGLATMTGGRLKRARDVIGQAPFCLTYGDGVSNVNIRHLIDFHKAEGRLATVTAVVPAGRFGVLGLDSAGTAVSHFREKDQKDSGLINGGFFVCQPEVIDLVAGDSTSWEREPMNRLVEMGQLAAFQHHGFWQAMDTMRDRQVLEELWSGGSPPWRVWQ